MLFRAFKLLHVRISSLMSFVTGEEQIIIRNAHSQMMKLEG